MIPRILEAGLNGPDSFRLTFNDQRSKTANVLPLLDGPILEPLRDPAHFATVVLDPTCGTVVWPKGRTSLPRLFRLSGPSANTSLSGPSERGRPPRARFAQASLLPSRASGRRLLALNRRSAALGD